VRRVAGLWMLVRYPPTSKGAAHRIRVARSHPSGGFALFSAVARRFESIESGPCVAHPLSSQRWTSVSFERARPCRPRPWSWRLLRALATRHQRAVFGAGPHRPWYFAPHPSCSHFAGRGAGR